MRLDISRQHRVLQLISKYGKISAKQLADELSVCTKTIYRDLDDLSTQYPIYIQKGRYGGISFIDGYKLPNQVMTLSQHAFLTKMLNSYSCNTNEDQEMLDSLKILFHL